MAEIKLQRTAYRFRSNSARYVKLSPLFLIGLLAALVKPEFFIKLKFSWFQSITLTEVEPGKHELSSLRDINLLAFFKNLSLSSSELFLLLLLLFTFIYSFVLLSCVWLTRFKLRLFYYKCVFKEGTAKFGEFVTNYATHVFVNEFVSDSSGLETLNRRTSFLLPLYRTGFIFYVHDYKKFVYNTSNNRFEPVEHIDEIDVSKVRNWQGLLSVSEGVDSKSGLQSNLNMCADLYGPNDYEIPRCNFWKMLMEAFLAPFFVFQLTSTLLWIFDDYLYYSLISIFSMVLIEVQMVYKRILEYNRINSMSLPPYFVYVYRDHKWQQVLTNQLYPGDILLLSTNPAANLTNPNLPGQNPGGGSSLKGASPATRGSKQGSTTGVENMLICPCDCLILEGEVIVDESILTGESIPQFKTSVEEESKNKRNSTIFSGTYILLTRNPAGSISQSNNLLGLKGGVSKTVEKLINDGCVCLVIRTGFESYQGRLVHSIINSDPNKVVNNNKQGYMFLLLLMVFAVASVAIVVKNSNYKSIKKLLLVSSRILVSVIPPEFPVTLSMAVTIGLIQLRRKGIYCTEPNRLPMAATIDVVAFDKTGTLTQDQMYLNGLYYTNSYHNYVYGLSRLTQSKEGVSRGDKLVDSPEINLLYWYSRLVVAGCHSLTYVNQLVTGDPMEKIPFKYFNNQIDTNNNNVVYLNFGSSEDSFEMKGEDKKVQHGEQGFVGTRENKENFTSNTNDGVGDKDSKTVLRILKRWRFTSELGRMSVLAQITTNSKGLYGDKNNLLMKDETLMLVKGSPEKIKTLLRVVPVYFDSVCHELTIKGLRVLCLAYKKLYDLPPSALLTIDRGIVEKDLEFCGFLALEAPIKNSSRLCMKRLRGHKQIMITGDNILTACHVTQEVNLDSQNNFGSQGLFNLTQPNKKGLLAKFKSLFSKGNNTGSVTLKDYLKNYHYNLVDECPLSTMKVDSLKKCPVYGEKEYNCPFLAKPKNEVKMYIQRCPLKQSLVNSYNNSNSLNSGTSATGTTNLSGVNGSQGDTASVNNISELFNRNSYKKFIETCPANINYNHSKAKCPLSQSNPDLTSLMNNTFSSSAVNVKSKKGGCPIKFCKRMVRTFYNTLIKVLFPSYYYTYIEDPLKNKEQEEEYFGSDNFGILSYHKGNFTWKRRNGEDFFPNSTNEQILQNMYRLLPNHKLCLTGTALEYLILNTKDTLSTGSTGTEGRSSGVVTNTSHSNNSTPSSMRSNGTSGVPDHESLSKLHTQTTLKNWSMSNTLLVINNCTVFARMSPQQKEFIIKCFKQNNNIVAMCGDGTNDVAALKQAHIGLSLLNTIKPPKTTESSRTSRVNKLKENLNDELPSIKLGEASIASPFTYHGSDVNCVFNLVKSGRCALSNVFMLYKLMGINSLITALGMSILALDGVNFSDAQTTLYSLLYTYLVLALSKSKPSDIPCEKKPARSIFSPSNFLSMALQIIVHSFFLLLVWNLGKQYRSPDYKGFLDAPFEPNIVNTLIYYVWYGINLSSFLSNYIDYPYMESMTTNKYLFKPILLSFVLLLVFVSDTVKPLNKFFSLVPIENYLLKFQLLSIVTLDVVLTYVISKVVNYVLT